MSSVDVRPTVLDKLLEYPTALGASGLLALAVWALVREQIISGVTHRRVVAERDAQIAQLQADCEEWKNLSLRLLGHAERVVQKTTESR